MPSLLRAQLCNFDANKSAECIPQVQQIADDHALTLLRFESALSSRAPMQRLIREICDSTRARWP